MTKPRRPSKPRSIPETALNVEALSLPANSDVKAERANRKHVERAQRLDVFALFLSRDAIPSIHYDAVRRLEVDIHTAAGVSGATEPGLGVSGGGCAELVSQRMIDASARVQAVLDHMPTHHAKLIASLLSPDEQGSVLTRWRTHVERITGARDKAGQGDVIRWICATTAEAWQALDYAAGERKRA